MKKQILIATSFVLSLSAMEEKHLVKAVGIISEAYDKEQAKKQLLEHREKEIVQQRGLRIYFERELSAVSVTEMALSLVDAFLLGQLAVSADQQTVKFNHYNDTDTTSPYTLKWKRARPLLCRAMHTSSKLADRTSYICALLNAASAFPLPLKKRVNILKLTFFPAVLLEIQRERLILLNKGILLECPAELAHKGFFAAAQRENLHSLKLLSLALQDTSSNIDALKYVLKIRQKAIAQFPAANKGIADLMQDFRATIRDNLIITPELFALVLAGSAAWVHKCHLSS